MKKKMSKISALRARAQLDRAADRLVSDYSYHVGVMTQFRFEESDLTRTMAVSRDGMFLRLHYNPGFVLRCSRQELVGVLLHETYHVLLGHLDLDRRRHSDHVALTIAMEVTANEFVREPLPGQPVTLEHYPGLPPLESTVTRYWRLVKMRKDAGAVGVARGVSTLDDHDFWLSPEERQQRSLERLVTWLLESRHGRSREWARLLRDSSARGQGPGGSKTRLSRRQRRARIDWNRELEPFAAHAELEPTLGRASRRFPHLHGAVPGLARRSRRVRVLAAIDTSGSVSTPLLEVIGSELDVLGRRHDVTVVECDRQIRARYSYRGRLREIHGRGGTDLRPPLEAECLGAVRPDVVVYFTDGAGRAPARAPGVPVIWCLPSDAARPARWGKVVRLAATRR